MAAPVVYLSADEILNAADHEYIEVAVPEWQPPGLDAAHHKPLRLRTLTADEAASYQKRIAKTTRDPRTGEVKVDLDLTEMKVLLVGMTAVDGNGARLFNDAQIRALGAKSERALTRAFEAANRLNSMGAKGVEDAVKLSELTQLDGSSTASASTSD
jgi:hypothetical protein